MIETNERTAQGQEGLMNVHAPFIADRQAAIPIEPRERSFDHPAVATQALAGVNSLARNPHLDVAAMQEATAARDVVRLVGMEFGRSFAPSPRGLCDRRHSVDQFLEHHAVVAVRPGQQRGQRNPVAFADHVPFRAWPAAIGGIRADRIAPLLAGTLALSRLARLQSIRPVSPSRSSRV